MAADADGGDRIPPQSLDAEESVLGAMMLQEEACNRAFEVLQEENSFHKESHRKIFRAMLDLHRENVPTDQVSVADRLKRKKWLKSVGGASYVAGLVERMPSAANVEHHAKIVLEKALLRKIISLGTSMAEEGYDARVDADTLLDEAESRVFSLAEHRLRGGFEAIEPLVFGTMELIDKYSSRKGLVTGVSTGFSELDKMTGGLQASDLIILAGRPSCGKTALALSIARTVGVDQKMPVGIFSLEMANQQIALRFLCAQARASLHKVRTGLRGREGTEILGRLGQASGILYEAPIYIDESGTLSPLEMRAKARRLRAEKGVELIIVDYLQLMSGDTNRDSRQQEISEVSRALKATAKELNLPVLALSQLSRAVEMRGGDKRPQLSDLRESGALEQDADVVLFIHRPKMYQAKDGTELPAQEDVADIIIGKQRNGPTGSIQLTFIPEYARFENLAMAHESAEVPF